MVDIDKFSKTNKARNKMSEKLLPLCRRCYTAIDSDTAVWHPSRPIKIYIAPRSCPVCREEKTYQDPDYPRQALPTEINGILCEVQHEKCIGKQFWNKAKWYIRQQEIAASTGNPYMPKLVDPDTEKVKRLLEQAKKESKKDGRNGPSDITSQSFNYVS